MRLFKYLAALIFVIVLAIVGFVYLAPEKATSLALDLERNGAGLEAKNIEVGGLRYAYLEGGKGEPVMLLHGFGGNKDNFTRASKLLTKQYRVIVPDITGFGESAHPSHADYSPTAQAKRLHKLASALGIKDIHLGGNSMGGQIALTYAALHPAEVKSLWLLDPAGINSAPSSELHELLATKKGNPLLVKNADDLVNLMKFAMSNPPFAPRPMLEILARERIVNYKLEKRIFSQIKADSVESRVKGLATPALIVWGKEDRLLNVASAEILHKLMPKSIVLLMPGTGHIPMLERPQKSAEDYLQFRKSI